MNAQVRQESNVVQVLIRYWDNVDKAVQIMQRFGDVRHVNVLNSERGLLEIVYYDVRAAQRAVEAKETMQCRLAAPCGNRKVRLPGTAALDESVVDKISDMYLDDAGGDFYTLVFFDTRDAEHYRMTALESNELLHSEWQEPWDDHHEPFRPYSGQSRLIEEEKSVASKQPWAPHALSSNARVGWWPWAEDGIMSSIAEEDENSEMNTFQPAPGTYTVLLQGIPLELLNRPCVDAILEQAGLANDVLQWQLKGKHMGICILMVVGQEGVCRCLNHFAGCRWGARASLISGNNIPGEPPTCYSRPTEEARRDVFDKSDWTVGCEYSIPARDYWLAEDQAISAVFPRAPKTFLKEGNFIPHAAKPTSEASTELSESDDEITKLQGRAQHLWYQPSGAC